ncbi:MAG: hypothetical protein K6B64_02865, partial [Acholeplasmatales bacterium]|nr:hypothetical protein [Acholeplasmatales bacterium]
DYAFFVDKGLYKMYCFPIGVIPFALYLIIGIIRSLIARGNNQILSIYWQEYYPYVFLNFDNVATYLIIISLVCLLFGIASISFGAYFAKCKTYDILKSEE